MKKKPTPKELNFRVIRLSHIIDNHFRKFLANEGLFIGQHKMLVCLIDNNGATAGFLAKKLNISPATASVSIKKMEKAGFIQKKPDKNDSRIIRLYATEKAKETADRVFLMFRNTDNLMLKGFSDDEKKQFKAYLERAIENLNEEV